MATRLAVDIAMLASSWSRDARLAVYGAQTVQCAARPITGTYAANVLTRDRFIAQTLRPGGFLTQTVALVRFVFLVVAVEERHLRIAFECQDMRRDAVEEPAIVRDHH